MISAITNIFVGILFMSISLPLVLGKVPMNSFYGFRFAKSYESKENWYNINAYGGRQMIPWSLFLIVLGIITFFLPIKDDPRFDAVSGCAPLIILIPVFQSYLFARRL